MVLDVYKITKVFPGEERFGLISQMRRAAVSVPANIAEGFKRRTKKNKAQFYNISESSLDELRYYLILSKDIGYMKDNKGFLDSCDEISRLLKGLIRSVAPNY